MKRPLAIAVQALVAACVMLLFGHIHMMSVYYPGSPHMPDAVHAVPVSYKGHLIYVQVGQQILIDRLMIAALGVGFAAVFLWGFGQLFIRWRNRSQSARVEELARPADHMEV